MVDEIKKQSLFDILRFIPSGVFIFGAVIIGIAIYAVEVAKIFTWQKAGIWIVIVIVAIFALGAKKKKEDYIRGEDECREILKAALKKKQELGDFSKGTIELTGEVGSEDVQKELHDYEFGFKVVDENTGVGKEWIAKVNPKYGDVYNYIKRPAGFSAKDTLKLRLHPKYYELWETEIDNKK